MDLCGLLVGNVTDSLCTQSLKKNNGMFVVCAYAPQRKCRTFMNNDGFYETERQWESRYQK